MLVAAIAATTSAGAAVTAAGNDGWAPAVAGRQSDAESTVAAIALWAGRGGAGWGGELAVSHAVAAQRGAFVMLTWDREWA